MYVMARLARISPLGMASSTGGQNPLSVGLCPPPPPWFLVALTSCQSNGREACLEILRGTTAHYEGRTFETTLNHRR
jgi:hypothetical protein